MRKVTVFNNVTLDGYFSGPGGDIGWARRQDPEMIQFTNENAASGGGAILLGRVTYDMMVSFWPTPQAAQAMPVVAERMNSGPKVVFSRTLERATWNNTTLVKGDLVAEVRKMKSEGLRDMVILGSGSIVAQLAPEGLIDEYQVVLNPVVVGKGRTMFEGIPEKIGLKLESTRAFGNGCVLLRYAAGG